jgi:outer membrane protein assembly factor BamB
VNTLLKSGLIALAVFLSTLPTKSNADWYTYQGNSSHTGYVPGSIKPETFQVLWQRTDLGGSLNPVTIAEGKVFASKDGYFTPGLSLTALDAATGNTLWTTGGFGSPFSVNPPAYSDGKVYIQTGNHGGDTYLHAFNATTGTLAFRAAHSAQWERYFAPTPFDGKVYINGGYYGGSYSFDGQDGTRLWFTGLPQYDEWTPAVDDSYVYAYVGEYSPALYVLNRATGTQAFSIPDPNFDWSGWSMNLAPVLGGQDNVLAIHNGRLINFDIPGRSIAWQKSRSFTGQPTVANGIIYAIDANALTAWNENTGTLLWSWASPDGNPLYGTMIATDSHLLVGTGSKTFAVNLTTHVDDWSFDAAGSLALDGGKLYIANSNGTLTALGVPEPSSCTLCLAVIAAGGALRRAPLRTRRCESGW